jgi:hypothetical protein
MVARAAYPGVMEDRFWTRRLRWRLRGARLWPTFALLTVLDGVLLHDHPIAGDGIGVFAGVLLAGFFNLIAVVLVAPLVSRRLRGSRPTEIADDRAGTIVVVGVTVVLAAIGFAHAGAVDDANHAMAAQLAAARRYFDRQAPPEYRVNRGHISTWKQSDSFFRTCIPGPDRDHALCVFVNTETNPPDVRLDPAHVPNPR